LLSSIGGSLATLNPSGAAAWWIVTSVSSSIVGSAALKLGGLLRGCHRRLPAPPPSLSSSIGGSTCCRCQSTGRLIVTSGVYSLIGINVVVIGSTALELGGLLHRCHHQLAAPWLIVRSLSTSGVYSSIGVSSGIYSSIGVLISVDWSFFFD
jgi:hypothetical protein